MIHSKGSAGTILRALTMVAGFVYVSSQLLPPLFDSERTFWIDFSIHAQQRANYGSDAADLILPQLNSSVIGDVLKDRGVASDDLGSFLPEIDQPDAAINGNSVLSTEVSFPNSLGGQASTPPPGTETLATPTSAGETPTAVVAASSTSLSGLFTQAPPIVATVLPVPSPTVIPTIAPALLPVIPTAVPSLLP